MPGPGGGDRFARFLSNDSSILGGVRRLLNVAQPAVGNEWIATVPGGVMWRLLAGTATLVTSATVANRNPGIVVNIQGIPMVGNATTLNVAANLNRQVLYQQGSAMFPASTLKAGIPVPLPLMWLEPGDQLTSSTSALQVGDQYSAVSLLIEEVYFTNQSLTEWAEEDQDVLNTMMGG